MYKPKIGDVIKHNGQSMVVVDIVNHENAGSCAYDRKYLVCDLNYLKQNQGVVVASDLEKHGTWIIVNSIEFPVFTKMDDVAPFSIEDAKCYVVRQRTAKTITVYK